MYRISILKTLICNSKARTYYNINRHVSFSKFYFAICRAKYRFRCDIWGPRIDAILAPAPQFKIQKRHFLIYLDQNLFTEQKYGIFIPTQLLIAVSGGGRYNRQNRESYCILLYRIISYHGQSYMTFLCNDTKRFE